MTVLASSLWLLFYCSIGWKVVPLPEIHVERMVFPSKIVCEAAREGAEGEGRYGLRCMQNEPQSIVSAWKECGERYFEILSVPDEGYGR